MTKASKIAVALIAICLLGATGSEASPEAPAGAPAIVEIAAGQLQYWAAGEFTRGGKPVEAPQLAVQIRKPLAIMARQVSVGEYRRCVAEKACSPLVDEGAGDDLPAVQVSWRDAQAYAKWLSHKFGRHYRLPTDEEWVYAAADRAPNEGPLARADDNPSVRALSRYEREAASQPVDPTPQPIGHFGVNKNGLYDIGGNVWEWTDTCFTRTVLDGDKARVVTENCGVRVVEGRHRTFLSDFIRDARGGGCGYGVPPSNLGFRLVEDRSTFWSLF